MGMTAMTRRAAPDAPGFLTGNACLAVLLMTMLALVPGTTGRSDQGLTNKDIIDLQASGMSEAVIVASIDAAEAVDFSTTPADLIELRDAGVSDAVILAMVKRSAATHAATAGTATAGGGEATGTPSEARPATAEYTIQPGDSAYDRLDIGDKEQRIIATMSESHAFFALLVNGQWVAFNKKLTNLGLYPPEEVGLVEVAGARLNREGELYRNILTLRAGPVGEVRVQPLLLLYNRTKSTMSGPAYVTTSCSAPQELTLSVEPGDKVEIRFVSEVLQKRNVFLFRPGKIRQVFEYAVNGNVVRTLDSSEFSPVPPPPGEDVFRHYGLL